MKGVVASNSLSAENSQPPFRAHVSGTSSQKGSRPASNQAPVNLPKMQSALRESMKAKVKRLLGRSLYQGGAVEQHSTHKKKSHQLKHYPEEEEHVTVMCNSQYNPSRFPSKKRVTFTPAPTDTNYTPSSSMGLFSKERELVTEAKTRHLKISDEQIIYVKASDFNYNRDDLFDNTPVFQYPSMNYNN